MTTSLEQLQEWMNDEEDEKLEFKEAKSNFHFEKLVKYCVALANERGGTMILGVTETEGNAHAEGRTSGARWFAGTEVE